MNVAEPVVAGTVTEAGTDSTVALSDVNAIVLPPDGAARLRVTVQVVAAPGARLTGAHASDDTVGLGVTVIVAVVLPPSVAVIVTVWDVATIPAMAVNVAELVVAGTVTDVGTGHAVMLSDESVTVLPPAGAG